MRRMLSLQAFQALVGSLPRILIVAGLLAAYYLATIWSQPFVPWWGVMLAGMALFGVLLYLGSRWLEHDVLRASREEPDGSPLPRRDELGP